jgi:2-polyprenyl-3-methyl-5-hydroxy-6-metoxy-1,4-benzoquinol methylase
MAQAFDFGKNWRSFSVRVLTTSRLDEAEKSLRGLLQGHDLRGKTFLDIGCGSGIFSMAAAHCGARRVVGFDLSSASVDTAQRNTERFKDWLGDCHLPEFRAGNVLTPETVEKLGTFDVVYSWGVLHHTGAMWEAIRKAAAFVARPDGLFVLAIYNRHWTAPAWRVAKRLYNVLPRWGRKTMVYLFSGVMLVGAWATTGRSPLRKERGMEFWHDLVDWLGGYPYEYASVQELVTFVEKLGFTCEHVIPTEGWTGCNEFVFARGPTWGERAVGYSPT